MSDDSSTKLQYCTVRINTSRPSHGTGFFISNDAILTCQHVVANVAAANITVTLNPDVAAQIARDGQSVAVKEIRYPDDPQRLDIALLLLDPETLSPHNHVVHLLPEYFVNDPDPVHAYGFQQGDQRFNGVPIDGNIAGDSSYENMKLVRFKDDRIGGGMSGAAVLNKRTGAVIGVIKRSDDMGFPVGGHFVPVREIFRHMPEVFERNRTYFADKPAHPWRRMESQLLQQHRLNSPLQAHEHHVLLIGNGYFPHLLLAYPKDHHTYPHITLAPEKIAEVIRQLLEKRQSTSITCVVDQPQTVIEEHMQRVLANPAQSTLLVYWGSSVREGPPYNVLHSASNDNRNGNIVLPSITRWVHLLALADKNVMLVLDLRNAQQHLGNQWLPTIHPCLSYVTWKNSPSAGETLAEPLRQAIQAINGRQQPVTARAVGEELQQDPNIVVHLPQRDFSLFPVA
ncbi:trypsin-like peptidase domain-containing protein [bacterium]|nr:trypsin-like peptidase domain-containing protein [bacterium]